LVSGEAYGMVNLDSGVRREDLNLKHVIGGGRALSRLDVFRARHSFGESSQPPRSPTGRVLPGRSGSGATLGHLTSASDTEWGGSEEERWAVFQEEGIRTSHLRPLVEQLDQDFEVASSGYAQFQTIADPYERAVVSELIGRSAMGLADNLLEARLAQHALAEMVPAEGLAMPTRKTARQHIRDGAWTDMHLAAFVRALESAFDCLAAVAMGVLRIPTPLAKAQLSQFRNLANL
jgi:hypothetical protein